MARASDEIDGIWWTLNWAGLLLGLILGLTSIGFALSRRGNLKESWQMAIPGGISALFPLLFALHVYHIDYVAIGIDGTPASPPVLSALAVPSIPLILCVTAGTIAWRKGR